MISETCKSCLINLRSMSHHLKHTSVTESQQRLLTVIFLLFLVETNFYLFSDHQDWIWEARLCCAKAILWFWMDEAAAVSSLSNSHCPPFARETLAIWTNWPIWSWVHQFKNAPAAQVLEPDCWSPCPQLWCKVQGVLNWNSTSKEKYILWTKLHF